MNYMLLGNFMGVNRHICHPFEITFVYKLTTGKNEIKIVLLNVSVTSSNIECVDGGNL